MDNSSVNQEAMAHVIEEFIKSGSCVLNSEGQILNLPYHFSYEAHKYLIQNGRLNPDNLLETALKQNKPYNMTEEEFAIRQEELVELSLANKADPNKVSYIHNMPSVKIMNLLLAGGLSSDKALELILRASTSTNYIATSEQKLVDLQKQLIDLTLEKGANIHTLEGRIFSHSLNTLDVEIYAKLLNLGLSVNTALKDTLNTNDLEKRKALLEFLLKNGLKADLLLDTTMSLPAGETQNKLIELAVKNKANINTIGFFQSLPSIEQLEHLLKMGLNPNNAMKLITNVSTSVYNYTINKRAPDEKLTELKHNLINFLIEKGANFNSVEYLYNYDSEDFEFLLERGFDLNKIAEMILKNYMRAYKPCSEEYTSVTITKTQKHILSAAIKAGVDFNSLEIFNSISSITDSNGMMVPEAIPHQIIEILVNEYSLNPRTALKYAIKNNMKELTHLASLKNIDLNSKNDGEELTLIEMAVIKGHMEMVDLMIAAGANQTIGLLSYIRSISPLNFSVALKIVEKFSHQYDEKKAYDLLRAQGLSEAVTKDFINYHNLINDYLSSTNGHTASILSPLELRLLDNDQKNENALEYQDVALNNKYGYNPLHLAIIAGKFELAESMVKNGFDIYAKTGNNVTPLQLLSRIDEDEMEFKSGDSPVKKFIKAIFDELSTVDIELGNGETIADILMRNSELTPKVIELTQDELFYFFKTDADLFIPSKNPDKTCIAISHGDGFWSSGIWSLARNLIKNHPETSFYLVTDEMLENGGDKFLKQFDAVINPGAGDSYPNHMPEFTKHDCPFSTNIELHYQNMLDKSYQLDIPYLGMCAGAQHFAMYHGGSVKPVKGYDGGKDHQVTFTKGTLAHFMALTKEEQNQALQNCDLPDVSVKGDTAHRYAAVNEKLGLDMQLGAVSEENVAMAFSHTNGIRYATQFHPEHHYTSMTANSNYEKSWIDNFIGIAHMHHEHRTQHNNHPINYFGDVQNRLASCIKQPTCLSDEFEIEINGANCSNDIDFV